MIGSPIRAAGSRLETESTLPATDPVSRFFGLAAWGGAECTVNRVGDTYRDQLEETGHARRAADFDLIVSLGLDAVRFPILWERVSPNGGAPNWRWSDLGLSKLQEEGVQVIAGLVHHGSGPRHTSLLDPSFSSGLATHAASVSQRYPWIQDWTPVNEPLTTARFSALYGTWYPHMRDERAFWLALLNQVDATRLAMRAIRRVQPEARLIQTEDLGRTYATPLAVEQAAYDNQRRWMTWDLLCGRVGPAHPLWERLTGFDLGLRLRAILDDPCPPDIIGINHYLTSDRFLDERTHLYPTGQQGGNGRLAYCDTEAVRVLNPGPQGLSGAINETWERYGLPIALTEVHNGCTREEQIRWLDEAWSTAREARSRGVDVRAVTAWSLFGSQGWDTLVTQSGKYEAGAFDVTSGIPRETALAYVIRARSTSKLGPGGWWNRSSRLRTNSLRRPAKIGSLVARSDEPSGAPVLIVGATGTLGQALAAECRSRNLPYILTGREIVDLADLRSVEKALEDHRPWAVINAAGWVRVDEAEHHPEECWAVNTEGAFALAQASARRGLPCLSFSSDLVFDGLASVPYEEPASVNPIGVYGESKAQLERRLATIPSPQLIVRTAAFFSAHDPYNFAVQCLRTLERGETFECVTDQTVSPTYVPDLCRAVLDLLIDREIGIWHLVNTGATSWFEFAKRLAVAADIPHDGVVPVESVSRSQAAKRPAYSALTTRRGQLMPTFENAIERFITEYRGG